jgi:REP element-mobilizing transposase RayT
MSRRKRLDLEGVWHHAMNRGAGRGVVFRTRRDGELFETLIGEASERTDVEVHAYCLMPNHFHLLVRCPNGGLSAFMQHIAAQFTRAVNRRAGSDGAIFRGRFHSIATDDPIYVHRIARYIHRNPLDIRDADPIETYRWSSLRAYLDADQRPPWLRTDLLDDSVAASSGDALTGNELRRLLDLLIAAHLEVGAGEHQSARSALCLDLVASGRPETQAAATSLLAFASPEAARSASRRAARFVADHPELRRLTGIVRDLAA